MPPLPAFHFGELFTAGGLAALAQVLLIDLALAGDNAVVVGALAARLSPRDRRRVIAVGVVAALVLRILFALAATMLVELPGLLLAGGVLLLWVAWRFWGELRRPHAEPSVSGQAPATVARAAWGVTVADLSMSLDNVLGVVGAARAHPAVLVIGLAASVLLMGVAANVVARVIGRHAWIGYLGLGVIVLVAGRMIWDGWDELGPRLGLA